MKSPLVSIIVPVYNVEKYINRCLESLVTQTYENIEVILIDDESKDSSGKICDEWAKRDNRIKVIHKKNAGSGFARNTGIEMASGDYIAYSDSDDYMDTHAIEKVVARILDTEADICYYGCVDVKSSGKRYGQPPHKLLYSGNEITEYIKNILGPLPNSTAVLFAGVSPWSGMVRRSILIDNNIRFPSERESLCEDVFYNLYICMNANRIAIEPSCLYYYCHNDNNSLTSNYRDDRFEAAKRMYYSLLELFNDYHDDQDLNNRLYRAFMQNLIVCFKQEVLYKDKNGRKIANKNIFRICNDSLVKECMRNYPIELMPIKQSLLFQAVKHKNVIGITLLVGLRTRR